MSPSLQKKFASAIFWTAALIAPSAFAQDDWRYGARLDWMNLKETLPSGQNFVTENGPRLEAYVLKSTQLPADFKLTYTGSVYGSYVRHQGNDPSRTTIPSGTEDTYTQYLGTRHKLSVWRPLGKIDGVQFGPAAAVGVDVWYRRLSYYEIWQVPSASLGLQAKKGIAAGMLDVELGVRRSIDARIRTQTTKAPWNASGDTTLSLGDRNNVYMSAKLGMKNGWTGGVYYEEQKFGASPSYALTSTLGIFQPQTTIRMVGISADHRF